MTMPDNLSPQDIRPSPFAKKKQVPSAKRVDWDTWYRKFSRDWLQDQHISIIGPTGTGKSTLSLELLKIRRYVVYTFTKPADDQLIAALNKRRYVMVPAFPKEPPEDVDRYLLWPGSSGQMSPEATAQQRMVLRDAFTKIFQGPPNGGQPGRWCITLDEARYVCDPQFLGLMREVKQLLIQGRSLRIAMVLSFQRPSWVPPEGYDQASHLFLANDNDRRNVQRFREIGGIDGDTVAATVQSLDLYEWLHVDARPGQGTMSIIKAPKGL